MISVRRKGWKVGKDQRGATGPYAYSDTQWVSFEDVASIKAKVSPPRPVTNFLPWLNLNVRVRGCVPLQARFVKNMGFGGAVAWTVDLDDFSNRCCLEPFPLLRAVNRVLGRLTEDEPAEGDCTRPPTPVTPPTPTLTTGVDTGEGVATSSTTWPSWTESETPTTTSWPSWQPDSTSTSTTTSAPSWEASTSTETLPSTSSTTQMPPTTIASPKPPTIEMPTTSETPGEVCQSGDYLPDPSNCNAYYRCILGELKKQYCAAGLHWNKEAKVCDWPTEGGCPSRKCDECPLCSYRSFSANESHFTLNVHGRDGRRVEQHDLQRPGPTDHVDNPYDEHQRMVDAHVDDGEARSVVDAPDNRH